MLQDLSPFWRQAGLERQFARQFASRRRQASGADRRQRRAEAPAHPRAASSCRAVPPPCALCARERAATFQIWFSHTEAAAQADLVFLCIHLLVTLGYILKAPRLLSLPTLLLLCTSVPPGLVRAQPYEPP